MTRSLNKVADFEENDLSDFDGGTTTGGAGAIAASAAAAMEGSFGCAVTVAGAGDAAYGALNGPAAETFIVVSLMFDLNSLAMGASEVWTLLYARNAASQPQVILDVRYASSTYYLRISVRKDDDTNILGSWWGVSDEPVTIMTIWKAATGAGNNNGLLNLYINGVLQESISGVDNDTKSIDHILIGAVTGIDAGTSGTFYLDYITWSNDHTMEQNASGSLASSGALSKKAMFNVAGVGSFAGALTKKTFFNVAGVESFSSSLNRKVFKALAGGLDFSGALFSLPSWALKAIIRLWATPDERIVLDEALEAVLKEGKIR